MRVAAAFRLRHVTYGLLFVSRCLKAAATPMIVLIALKDQGKALVWAVSSGRIPDDA